MSARAGSGGPWLVPACLLLVTVVAAVSWPVVRPGTDPFAAPSVVPSGVVREASARFTFEEPAAYEWAEVDVRRDGDTVAVEAFATKRGRPAIAFGSTSCATTTACPVWDDGFLALSLLPGQARDVGSLDNGRVQVDYLDDADLTAVAVQRVPGSTSRRLIWRAEDDRLVDSGGSEVAEVQVSAGVYAITIFEARALGVWGYFDRRNGGWVARSLGTEPVELVGTPGTGTSDAQRFTEAGWVGLLPVGARHPDLVTDAGVVWRAAPLGSTGRLALAVFVESRRAAGTGVRSISWTDASGKRRTYKP